MTTAPEMVTCRYSMRWPITEIRTPLDQLLAAATGDLVEQLRAIRARQVAQPDWRLARPFGRLHLVCDVSVEMNARDAKRHA